MSETIEFFDFANSFLKEVIHRFCHNNDVSSLRLYIEKSTHQKTLQEAMYKGFYVALMFGNVDIMKEIMRHSSVFEEEKKKLKKEFLKDAFLSSMYLEKKEVSQLLLHYNPDLLEHKGVKTKIKKMNFRVPEYKAYLLECYHITQEKSKLNKKLLSKTLNPRSIKIKI